MTHNPPTVKVNDYIPLKQVTENKTIASRKSILTQDNNDKGIYHKTARLHSGKHIHGDDIFWERHPSEPNHNKEVHKNNTRQKVNQMFYIITPTDISRDMESICLNNTTIVELLHGRKQFIYMPTARGRHFSGINPFRERCNPSKKERWKEARILLKGEQYIPSNH